MQTDIKKKMDEIEFFLSIAIRNAGQDGIVIAFRYRIKRE